MSARIVLVAAGFAAAVLVPGAALAQDAQGMRSIPGYQPSQLELALDGIEARMADYAARAEAISSDSRLTDAEREAGLSALSAEYQPEFTQLATGAAEFGLRIAGAALQSIDIGRLVETALAAADIEGALIASADAVSAAVAAADAAGAVTID